MPRPRLPFILALGLLALCGQVLAEPATDYAKAYAAAYAAHDFFALRALSAADTSPDSEQKRFYKATVLTAFNQPAAANRIINALLANNIDTALMPFLLQMRLTNDRRLYNYAGALDTERTLIDYDERKGDAAGLADAQNGARLLAALSDAAPQQVRRSGDSHIILAQDSQLGYCIPLTIGTDPCYILDSGANLSTLAHSEAERLNLTIVPAGYKISDSNGRVVSADVAVAPSVLLGNVQYTNVVFLVLPDAAMTLPGFTIPGILGYPVFVGLGAVVNRHGHVIDVPRNVPDRPVDNIALDDNDILTQIQVDGHAALCRVDTGADHTVFYKSYYDLHKDEVEKAGKPHAVKTAGVGGLKTLASYRLPQLQVTIAGRPVTLKRVNVLTEKSIGKDYLQCNLGADAFRSYRSYTINLQAMSLTLN